MDTQELENEAFKCFHIYAKRFKKKTYKNIQTKNPKKSKWWKYFVELVEKFSDREGWNASNFINFCFDEYGVIYPPQLKADFRWNDYKDIVERGDFDYDKDTAIAKDLLNMYKRILYWCKAKNISFSTRVFFGNPVNRRFLSRGNYSPYFLAICKPFREYYEGLTEKNKNEIISEKDLDTKRAMVYKNKKLWNKMKEILGEELW